MGPEISLLNDNLATIVELFQVVNDLPYVHAVIALRRWLTVFQPVC